MLRFFYKFIKHRHQFLRPREVCIFFQNKLVRRSKIVEKGSNIVSHSLFTLYLFDTKSV